MLKTLLRKVEPSSKNWRSGSNSNARATCGSDPHHRVRLAAGLPPKSPIGLSSASTWKCHFLLGIPHFQSHFDSKNLCENYREKKGMCTCHSLCHELGNTPGFHLFFLGWHFRSWSLRLLFGVMTPRRPISKSLNRPIHSSWFDGFILFLFFDKGHW